MASKAKKAGGGADKTECVKVAVRLRPLNRREREENQVSCVETDSIRGSVFIQKPGDSKEEPKTFTFDYVYGPDSLQSKVFEDTARPIVDSVLGGYNGTMFAYGQTGTGKTHTMEGDMDDEKMRGIMPNSFYYIMNAVQNTAKNTEFLVRMSFLEIYKEEVFDLLNKENRKRMEVRENPETGVFVEHLSTYVVKSVPDMLKVLKRGQKARKVGATNMNEGSSRSHSILSIIIEASEAKTDEEKALQPSGGDAKYRAGKLNLVDLAGSERQKKTGAEGDRLSEAKSINQSLSALGNVIKALVNPGSSHVPFRDSKLTRLLQDSLGGNTKTLMIAALGPSADSWDETMSTLRYANRAKNIKNKPKINEDPKDTMLRECQEEITRLKAALEAKAKGLPLPGGLGIPGGPSMSGAMNGAGAAQSPIVKETVVEKEVEVHTGIGEEDLKKIDDAVAHDALKVKAALDDAVAQLDASKQVAETKQKMFEDDAKRKAELLEKEKADLAAIQQLLADRERQLMHGAQDLDAAARQKAKLKAADEELRIRKEKEEQLKAELRAAEEKELYMNETFKSGEEEFNAKSTKIKQLHTKYNEKKQELEDLQEDFEAEREELVDTIRQLDREIKLKHLVLDSFVPPHYIEMVEQRAIFDDRNDQWIINGLELACNNIRRELTGGIVPMGSGGGGAPGGRQLRRPPLPNYARLTGGLMMTPGSAPPAIGLGRGGFGGPQGPNGGAEMAPEMQQILRQAMETEQGPRAPKDMYYTYGQTEQDDATTAATTRGRRKRR